MTTKQIIAAELFNRIPWAIRNRAATTSIIVPYYHMVSDHGISHIKHLYSHKSIKLFREDLECLLSRYRPIDLFQFLDHIQERSRIEENAFLLTFDDGFREMYEIVAPILIEKGISATFFINSAFIDNKEMCFRNKASLVVERLIGIGFKRISKKSNGYDVYEEGGIC